ncbi:hypothetical protein [Kineococcus gypseus]|uniref:hypothetical protein n=1 Tax=Kineococcus gypseus TaxID=1637102 RepID=UPI003D7E9E93
MSTTVPGSSVPARSNTASTGAAPSATGSRRRGPEVSSAARRRRRISSYLRICPVTLGQWVSRQYAFQSTTAVSKPHSSTSAGSSERCRARVLSSTKRSSASVYALYRSM